MIDLTDVIEKHGLKNNKLNRTWLRLVFYTTLIVSLPSEIVKYIFKR